MVMQIDDEEAGLVRVLEIPAAKLQYDVPGQIYVAYERQDIDDFPIGKLNDKREPNPIRILILFIYSFIHKYIEICCQGL